MVKNKETIYSDLNTLFTWITLFTILIISVANILVSNYPDSDKTEKIVQEIYTVMTCLVGVIVIITLLTKGWMPLRSLRNAYNLCLIVFTIVVITPLYIMYGSIWLVPIYRIFGENAVYFITMGLLGGSFLLLLISLAILLLGEYFAILPKKVQGWIKEKWKELLIAILFYGFVVAIVSLFVIFH